MKVEGTLEKKNSEQRIDRKYNITREVILCLIGLVLIFMPEALNKFVGIIIGLGLLLIGLVSIYRNFQLKTNNFNLMMGIIYSVLGVIVMLYPYSVINFAAKCLGVYLIIVALVKIRTAFILKDVNSLWLGTLIVGLIILIAALLLIFNPFAGIAITKLAGIFLILVVLCDVIDMYILQRK